MYTRIITIALMALSILSCSNKQDTTNLYDFQITQQDNTTLPLDTYKGKVVLIVNTATRCGFTPQYSQLENLHKQYNRKGLEILDFPCNQFGGQSPESDEETTAFCQLNYDTHFAQLQEIEVNGVNEHPLYTWLKSQQGFNGFDFSHEKAHILHARLLQQDSLYASKPDIKWNFTKFLIDRNGNVIARYEPTADMNKIQEDIEKLL